jgi:hypothetical protein
MNSPTRRETVTYIVRIWAEYLHEHPPRWCGEIETIDSGKKKHFSELSQMTNLILKNTLPSHLKNIEEIKK